MKKAHKGQKRRTGEPFWTHPLATKVKRMDLLHNMRTAKPHTKVKYQKALTILEK